MIRIKQLHRKLENELYAVEKMMSTAAMQGLMEYDRTALSEALRALLFCEFHDILPGSSIQPVEETAMRILGYGLEIAGRLRARAFFALTSAEARGNAEEMPIFVYNPQPYPVKSVVEVEFQRDAQNWSGTYHVPVMYKAEDKMPTQCEETFCSLNLDWRKHAVFEADLAPSAVTRFTCRMVEMPKRPLPEIPAVDDKFIFDNGTLKLVISAVTGLVESWTVNGKEIVKPDAFCPIVIKDNEDPWGMTVLGFRDYAGKFELMSPADAMKFSGTHVLIPSVRVIEDGEVRTVVEALMKYSDSSLVMRYVLPKKGTEFEVQVRVVWNEPVHMLKLSVPTTIEGAAFLGQVAYGTEELGNDGTEYVSQKWVAAKADDFTVTCINNGTYSADCKDGELRLSLLRSPGYSVHPIMDREYRLQSRFHPHIDLGERMFSFWFNAGVTSERLNSIDRESQLRNEAPYALCFFPAGNTFKKKPVPAILLDNSNVQLAAFKKAEKNEDYIMRLFEPTGKSAATTVKIPPLGIEQRVELGKFEIKTLRVDVANKKLVPVDLMEK